MQPPPDIEATILRLQRRLERERNARMESESIAESGLRELYMRQQQLQLLEVVATAANQNASVEHALAFVLAQVSRFVGWRLGHAFLRDPVGADRLVSSGVWYVEDDADFTAFKQATAALRLDRGVGLPGRVMATRQPAWVEDLSQDMNFPRVDVACASGIRAAFAFPVLVGEEVGAVLEFFSSEPQAPQDHVLSIMSQVGAQLGRIIERRQAQDQLLANNLELKRMVAEAEAQRQAAEAANRAKSDFLAVTSHEIRTPLNAVLGLTEALKRETLTTRQRDLVDGVLDGGAMLLRLLNAVLDLSKIEAGKMTAHFDAFSPRRMAEVVVRVWGPRCEEMGVGLALDLDDLPDDCCVLADEGKLEQTLVNLISNAVKFSPPGGRIQVRLGARQVGDAWRLRIEVQDQGPGIPAEDRVRIFQPFEQGELGRVNGGTGLGLAICAGNIALMGGKLGVESPPAGGSCFWLELKAAATTLEAPAEAPDAGRDPAMDRPLRILAAEDHAANRMVLTALLGPTGVELTLVNDGEAAVAAMAAGAFDLVLMDVNMPVMDGVAAVQAIRVMGGAAKATPIYMLTANAFEEDVRRYRAAGADGVLKKPIDVAELFGVLEQVAAALAAAA